MYVIMTLLFLQFYSVFTFFSSFSSPLPFLLFHLIFTNPSSSVSTFWSLLYNFPPLLLYTSLFFPVFLFLLSSSLVLFSSLSLLLKPPFSFFSGGKDRRAGQHPSACRLLLQSWRMSAPPRLVGHHNPVPSDRWSRVR